MSTRDEILAKLHAQARAAKLPSPWQSRRQFDDPAGRFTESLEKVQGQVLRTRALDEALDRVGGLLTELGVRSVVVNDELPVNEVDWPARFPGIEFTKPPRSAQTSEISRAWRETCARAGVGLTGADAALAETGSLVISSGPGKSRLVSLLPPVHIAIVPVQRLTTDIFTWMEKHDRKFPANTVLVSGPSKTADIEQTMAVGVHGPKIFIVVLLGE